jgi:hypothetical protein
MNPDTQFGTDVQWRDIASHFGNMPVHVSGYLNTKDNFCFRAQNLNEAPHQLVGDLSVIMESLVAYEASPTHILRISAVGRIDGFAMHPREVARAKELAVAHCRYENCLLSIIRFQKGGKADACFNRLYKHKKLAGIDPNNVRNWVLDAENHTYVQPKAFFTDEEMIYLIAKRTDRRVHLYTDLKAMIKKPWKVLGYMKTKKGDATKHKETDLHINVSDNHAILFRYDMHVENVVYHNDCDELVVFTQLESLLTSHKSGYDGIDELDYCINADTPSEDNKKGTSIMHKHYRPSSFTQRLKDDAKKAYYYIVNPTQMFFCMFKEKYGI